MARHVASARLVPQANRLGLAWHSRAESALADGAIPMSCVALARCCVAANGGLNVLDRTHHTFFGRMPRRSMTH
jgi:hypothetical protein